MSTRILFIAGPGLSKSPDLIVTERERLLADTENSVVDMEMVDRLPAISVEKSCYDRIDMGNLEPFHAITREILSKLLISLKPNGRLDIGVPVLAEAGPNQEQMNQITNMKLWWSPKMYKEQMISLIKTCGYCDIQELSYENISKDVADDVKRIWQLEGSADDIIRNYRILRIRCYKPKFEVGASVKLNLRNKSKNLRPLQDKVDPNNNTISRLDDGDELIDESTLLTEDDIVKPSVDSLRANKSSGCETKRKACKNCSCGRAEMEANAVKINGSDTMDALPKSSCGSCYLGDAFRCSSCPYRGMPAFKPGEKVKISSSFMEDDI